jgi:dihydropteroate synthase
MGRIVAEYQAGYVAMHMQGIPETMQLAPHYGDIVREISRGLAVRLDQLLQCGVRPEQVVLDPGIGFGKTLAHNLELLRHVGRITELRRPVMIGISRKSFVGSVLRRGIEERLPGTIAGTLWAVQAGVRLIRTHDVRATKDALTLWGLLLGTEPLADGSD